MSDEQPRGSPNFLKAAFLNVYNLSLLGGAVAASAATGDWLITAAAGAVEALWLIIGPDLKPFQRYVRSLDRQEQEAKDRARVEQLMASLPEREWQRAKALDELRRDIERDMQHNTAFQAILLQTELDKLSQLHQSFVKLAASCQRAETYLQAIDTRELERNLETQKTLASKTSEPDVRTLAEKNAEVLTKRLETIKGITAFLARARGQMNLIENSVRLMRDQALTMSSPAQLTDQLDDLLTGVEAVQQSVKDEEAILSGAMDPVVPVTGETQGARGRSRVRD